MGAIFGSVEKTGLLIKMPLMRKMEYRVSV